MRKLSIALVVVCVAAFALMMTRGEEIAVRLSQKGEAPANVAPECISWLGGPKEQGDSCTLSSRDTGQCRWTIKYWSGLRNGKRTGGKTETMACHAVPL